MRTLIFVIALALPCPLLAACTAGGSPPTPFGSENAALRPSARTGIVIDEPIQPVLLGIGQLTVAGLSEVGYSGTFTGTSSGKSSCDGIATWTPHRGKGNPFDVTVKALKLGSCTITFSDSNKHKAQLTLKVNFESLFSFKGGSDGATPLGIVALGGAFYGTTNAGGTAGCYQSGSFLLFGLIGCGTVFELSPGSPPARYTEHVLHTFTGAPDGGTPESGLTVLNGVLYGTTAEGGTAYPAEDCCGSVYSVTTAGLESVLYSFPSASNDGFVPFASLTAEGGELYGTTSLGGDPGYGYVGGGIVFQMSTAGTEHVLYTFSWSSDGSNGYDPKESSLTPLKGMLYGTTSDGGNDYHWADTPGWGTLFAVDPHTQTGQILYLFNGGAKDGANPNAGVVVFNGLLYGTTTQGGAKNGPDCQYGVNCGPGTLFEFDPKTSTEKIVHVFSGEGTPTSGLTVFNGRLYGTTQPYGTSAGTVFVLNPTNSAEQVLHSFSVTDGAYPGNLIVVNGTLYGTTQRGGASHAGTLFEVTP